jgi:hypothetical protein
MVWIDWQLVEALSLAIDDVASDCLSDEGSNCAKGWWRTLPVFLTDLPLVRKCTVESVTFSASPYRTFQNASKWTFSKVGNEKPQVRCCR